MKQELETPSIITSSQKATEIIRVWIADNKPTFVISGNIFKDPAAWGLILCDLARHISKACAQKGQDEKNVLQRIRKAFDVEWNNPTG
jgi:hypothetical protein